MTRTVYAALGLSRNPFPPTPDAESYFFTPRLQEDFAEIEHCIEARKGFVLLTGEVGLGKSTLVRRLLDTVQEKGCNSALILNTFLQDGALLSAIQSDFGLPASDSVEQGLAQLTQFLIAKHQAGQTSLLVIDDAQNLSVSSLELVRLLCNLETGQEKLLQILLVGQPELELTLARTELRQLKSRIIKHVRLVGLKKDEVARYFEFRVNAAGAEGRLSMESSAALALHRASQGNLRRIHLLLDRCLYGLISARSTCVTAALVERAQAELPVLEGVLRPEVAKRSGSYRKAWVGAGLLTGAIATVAAASLGIAMTSQSIDVSVVEQADSLLSQTEAIPPAPVMAAMPAQRLDRLGCEQRLKAVAKTGDVLHVQQLPDGVAERLKASEKLCHFEQNSHQWLAWLGGNEVMYIQAAQQTTRQVQQSLKALGLLEGEIDGLFGMKTAQAFARFQQQQGLLATGQTDALTYLLLEHQNATLH